MNSIKTANPANVLTINTMAPMMIQYHFKACSACRHEPEPPHTISGTISVMTKIATAVFTAV